MADQYWYCLKHSTVESKELCQGADRMGPYPSRSEAEQALQGAAQRTQQWETDPKWNDEG